MHLDEGIAGPVLDEERQGVAPAVFDPDIGQEDDGSGRLLFRGIDDGDLVALQFDDPLAVFVLIIFNRNPDRVEAVAVPFAVVDQVDLDISIGRGSARGHIGPGRLPGGNQHKKKTAQGGQEGTETVLHRS